MTPQLYEACRKAVHIIKAEGQIIKAGRATLFILEEIGYPTWLIRPFTWPPSVWFIELGYQIIGRNRPFFSRFFFTRED